MLSGRVMIVSDRTEVIAELERILRGGSHLTLAVSDAAEALEALQDGMVPDLLISDLGSESALSAMDYIWRFRGLNRAGRHLMVVEEGAPFAAAGDDASDPVSLPRPFDAANVRQRVDAALRAIERDLHSLRAEMWREMDQLRRSVRDAQREMVSALAQTLAARDPYMHGHCARVAELSMKIGIVLGLSSEELETLETAALLHEIGKVAVPLELLHKTETLTPDELELIRSHARVGAGIVGGVASLQRIVPLVEHQHTDYGELSAHLDPNAPAFLLTGVLHAVDAYDAMVSARSYRDAMDRGYWEANLRGGAGTLYHPEVVAALLRVLGLAATDTATDAPVRHLALSA